MSQRTLCGAAASSLSRLYSPLLWVAVSWQLSRACPDVLHWRLAMWRGPQRTHAPGLHAMPLCGGLCWTVGYQGMQGAGYDHDADGWR